MIESDGHSDYSPTLRSAQVYLILECYDGAPTSSASVFSLRFFPVNEFKVTFVDIFVQGYRPGAIAAFGFSPHAAAHLRPGII